MRCAVGEIHEKQGVRASAPYIRGYFAAPVLKDEDCISGRDPDVILAYRGHSSGWISSFPDVGIRLQWELEHDKTNKLNAILKALVTKGELK